jgi:uncharacterized damage-inducible protein DinB
MTHTALNKMFSKIEKQRNNIFVKLEKYSDKTLNQKPSVGAWSVIEVIDHLTIAEKYSYQYLTKKLQDKTASNKVGLKEAFRSILLNAYLASPKKFAAPSISLPSDNYITLNNAKEEWLKVRTDTAALLDTVPEDMLDRNWFKHPVAGKLSLMHMLTFMKAHVSHHERQIERTLVHLTQSK